MTLMLALFYYHCIGEEPFSVSPSVFRRQMVYLKQRGYRSLRVGEIGAELARNTLPSRAVGISFDDGFKNVFTCAVPILEELGFTATCFVTLDYIGSTLWAAPEGNTWRWNRERRGVPCRMLDWQDLREMRDRGMEIGAHTITHRNLPQLSLPEAGREIRDSKDILQRQLGIEVLSFAYPRGQCNAVLAGIVKESGYTAACTTQFGYVHGGCDPGLVPRIPGPRLLADFVQRVEMPHPPWTVRQLGRGLGLLERVLRCAERRPG